MINILLISKDIHATRRFYENLGVNLVEEKHEQGPVHFSFQDDIIMEVYPTRTTNESNIVIRIPVKDIHSKQARSDQLKLKDPDGRVVEIVAQTTP